MSAQIGILGESSVVTGSTTTTVYTVPADKGARIQVLFGIEAAAGTAIDASIEIGTPGGEINITLNPSGGGVDIISGRAVAASTDLNTMVDFGIDQGAGIISLTSSPGDTMSVIAPLPPQYFLSTGDTVKFQNRSGVAFADVLFQVQGVEDDA
jgi:hypothetical protein